MADRMNDPASNFFTSLDAGFYCDNNEPVKPDPSPVHHQNSSYFADPTWDFQNTPPYESSYDQCIVLPQAAAAPAAAAAPPPPHRNHGDQQVAAPFQTIPWNYSPSLVSGPIIDHYSDASLSPSSSSLPSGHIPSPHNYSLGQSPTEPPALTQQQSPSSLASVSDPLQILTPAQQNIQRAVVAMPSNLQCQSPTSEPSPLSATSDVKVAVSFSSPDTAGSSGRDRKRKAVAEVNPDVEYDDDDDDDDSAHPVKKTAHNMIEKRYRNNLNDKIAALRDSVPSLRIMSKSARGEDTTEDREELHGLTPAHKLNKATILSKATEYIRHLEKRNARLIDENDSMHARIAAFEKLVMGGAMPGLMTTTAQPGPPMQFSHENLSFVNTPMETPPDGNPNPPPSIIGQQLPGQVFGVSPPQSFPPNAAIIRQQQIQKQQQSQQSRWVNAGPYFGKLMAGSMAGLMFVSAMRESEPSSETTDGRGLFGIPFHLLGHIFGKSAHVNVSGYPLFSSAIIRHLEALVFAAVFLWFFVPFILLYAKPPKNKAESSTPQTAPSLASPIQVRRQAWLTAIQTVWVPEHNNFLEVVALILKAMKLSLRNTIGIRGYQFLTGLTEEQETARVRAWTVALDAQLAGGDVEINRGRLILTLVASLTLPTTPLRLMMQALHIRLILWNMGRNGLFAGILSMVAVKLARNRWNEARQLNRIMTQLRRAGPQPDDEPLPDHLTALLEQKCDDVFNKAVVQRAYNLGWNHATMHETSSRMDGMDSVVEDAAIRSPLDAVAAWRCCQILYDAAKMSLKALTADTDTDTNTDADVDADTDTNRDTDPSICEKVKFAIRIAPVGSTAHARALVTRAVIVSQNRGASIVAALQVVGIDQFVQGGVVAGSTTSLARPDFRLPLRCAVALMHLAGANRATMPADTSPGIRVIGTISLVGPDAHMSLLGCAAALQLMEQMAIHKSAAKIFCNDLERLSGGLRIWIGSQDGARCGLSQQLRRKLIKRCLAVTKNEVGMEDVEDDSGYGSMSGTEDGIEGACLRFL